MGLPIGTGIHPSIRAPAGCPGTSATVPRSPCWGRRIISRRLTYGQAHRLLRRCPASAGRILSRQYRPDARTSERPCLSYHNIVLITTSPSPPTLRVGFLIIPGPLALRDTTPSASVNASDRTQLQRHVCGSSDLSHR